MTSEAPQPAPLPERVQAILDATSGHTAGPWTYNEGSICHGYEVRDGKRTATWIADIDHQNQDDYADDGYHSYSPQADRDAALIAAAPTLRALLAEAAAALAAAEAERDALRAALERTREALTPSSVTKGAYMGEFRFWVPVMDEEGEEAELFIDTPWDTIKQIMAAISARAALGGNS